MYVNTHLFNGVILLAFFFILPNFKKISMYHFDFQIIMSAKLGDHVTRNVRTLMVTTHAAVTQGTF